MEYSDNTDNTHHQPTKTSMDNATVSLVCWIVSASLLIAILAILYFQVVTHRREVTLIRLTAQSRCHRHCDIPPMVENIEHEMNQDQSTSDVFFITNPANSPDHTILDVAVSHSKDTSLLNGSPQSGDKPEEMIFPDVGVNVTDGDTDASKGDKNLPDKDETSSDDVAGCSKSIEQRDVSIQVGVSVLTAFCHTRGQTEDTSDMIYSNPAFDQTFK